MMYRWISAVLTLIVALMLAAPASAQQGDLETKGKAFCDGMATALTTNKGNCPAMGKAFSAHLDANMDFLKKHAREIDQNPALSEHCKRALEPNIEALAACASDPAMGDALQKLSQIGEESRPKPAAESPPYVSPPLPEGTNPALTNPALATATAPAVYNVRFETTQGDIVVEVHRDWSPNGADRFFNLVNIGYYNDAAFFRAISGFMIQFGINGHPDVNKAWSEARIMDDPASQSNTPGMVSFATAGPNTRTTQLFINTGDNNRLDSMGFTPFGKVVTGMDVVAKLYTGYGEGAPGGMGPRQDRVQGEGNAYLRGDFPKLDYIKRASVLEVK